MVCSHEVMLSAAEANEGKPGLFMVQGCKKTLAGYT